MSMLNWHPHLADSIKHIVDGGFTRNTGPSSSGYKLEVIGVTRLSYGQPEWRSMQRAKTLKHDS